MKSVASPRNQNDQTPVLAGFLDRFDKDDSASARKD